MVRSMKDLVADAPEYPEAVGRGCERSGPEGKTDRCPMYERCQARVRNMLWTYCEIPDEADLLLAQGVNFPYVVIEYETGGI